MSLSFSHIERNAATGERTPVFTSPEAEGFIPMSRDSLKYAFGLSKEEAAKAENVLAITEAAAAGFAAIPEGGTPNKTLKNYVYKVIYNFIDTDADTDCTVKVMGPNAEKDTALFYDTSERSSVIAIGVSEGRGGPLIAGFTFMEAKENGLPTPLILAADHVAEKNETYQLDKVLVAIEQFFEIAAKNASPAGQRWLLRTLQENVSPAPKNVVPFSPESSLG
ncbi:MAG: hypothetical protein LRZ85_04200 [Alphaproteobacteria bacterium]|nr:hypothetical protein [Alphaproteobacteria bacterium]MCD8520409.1 hypothetical protein [Alphaproteobacteria bacterium]MCD8525790.1 hypothetical protein [Alphaproteobacteria bacterium]MCD8570095.1 hypothetical protein [Alphaproteobacteria bacterium]